MIDNELNLSNAQSITASAASTNYIDQKAAGDSVENPYVLVRVITAFATLTSLNVAIQTDDNSSFSSPKTLARSAEVPRASLTANAVIMKMRLPTGLERYIRLYYTVTGSDATAGKVSADILDSVPKE